MKIGIELNGVLRDTIEKFGQTYEKYLIDSESTEYKVEYKLARQALWPRSLPLDHLLQKAPL